MTGAQQLTEKVQKQAFDKGLEKGLEQGLEKGLEKGLAVGRADLLIKLLEGSYGTLSPERVAVVRGATVAELDAWAVRLLKADAIDDVFGD